MAAVISARREVLAYVVGCEQGNAARSAVDERGLHRLPQVTQAGEVVQCILNKDSIERSPKSQRAHVAVDVLAIRVDRLTEP